MARSHPGQLSLFDDTLPPPPPPAVALENAEETEAGFATEPDRVVLALLVSGKSAGPVLAAARHVAAQHEIEIPAEAEPSLFISMFDFGTFDALDAEEVETVLEAGAAVEMRRFDVALSTLGSCDDGGVALFADDSGIIDAFTDCVRGALRERGGPLPDADRPHLVLCRSAMDIGPITLDRPLHLSIREYALLRIWGDGYEVLRKWALAA